MAYGTSETKVGKAGYNTTHLGVKMGVDRHWLHRDRFAHWLRWQHICKVVKRKKDKVLDLGCGDGSLALALYANMLGPKHYMGVDFRGKTLLTAAKQKTNFECTWLQADLCDPKDVVWATAHAYQADIITNFEMIEHIPRKEVEPFLNRVKRVMTDKTTFFLSTPCFDGKTKSKNHLHEYEFTELMVVLEDIFEVEDVWGTFISKKDLDAVVTKENLSLGPLIERLRGYYHSAAMSVMLAPLFPAYSRNCIWKLRRK